MNIRIARSALASVLTLFTVAFPALARGEPVTLDDLHLQCAGEASFTRLHGGTATLSGAAGSAHVNFATSDEDRFNDDVLVDLVNGQARIRIPRRMLPPLHTGDEEGWRPIVPLRVDDRQINGHFTMNFLNKPSVNIDRATGRIEIVGHRDFGFRGDCKTYDPKGDRKF